MGSVCETGRPPSLASMTTKLAAKIIAFVLLGCCLGEKRYRLKILDRTRYLPLQEAEQFLFNLRSLAPETLKLKKIGNTKMEGKSWENDIFAAVIGKDTDPIKLFDCGIHAREWISPASCLTAIEFLVRVFDESRRRDIQISSVTNYQWHIIPVLNPDGYNISHQSPRHVYRMHRKNGRPLSTMQLNEVNMQGCQDECKNRPHKCIGVDLNRNFPAGYGKGDEEFEILSQQVRREVYRADHYFSEPETRALNNYVRSIRNRIVAAISIHAFGKVIDHPNGWLKAADPNQANPYDVARMRYFIRGFNKYLDYNYGYVEEVFGEKSLAGGASEDFYYNYHDIKISLTIELDPGLDERRIGFKLPAKYIKPVGLKFWRAIQGMAIRMNLLQEDLMRLNSKHSNRQETMSSAKSAARLSSRAL